MTEGIFIKSGPGLGQEAWPTPQHRGETPDSRIGSAQDGPSNYCDVIPKNKQLGQGPGMQARPRSQQAEA